MTLQWYFATFLWLDDYFATLEEFVDFLTTVDDDRDINEPHWIPIEKYCNPCILDYDVIMHTETLDEDIR